MMREEITEELWRIIENSTRKRKGLLLIATENVRNRRRLSLLAGVLALLSAGSITSLLADALPRGVMTVLAALFATASGFLSLLTSLTLKDTELEQLYEGASRYLNLRDRCHRMLLNKALTSKQAETGLEEVQKSYADLDGLFTRFLVAAAEGAPGASTGPTPPAGKGRGVEDELKSLRDQVNAKGSPDTPQRPSDPPGT